MSTEFDFKGKHYTNIVNKVPVPVTIKTRTSLIKGTYHISPNARIKDELNDPKDGTFAAVTDAIVYDSLGVKQYTVGFLALNRNTIEWLVVDEKE